MLAHRHRNISHMEKREAQSRICANGCGRNVVRNAAQYCSQDCRHQHYRDRVIALWKSGALPHRPTILKVLRRHLIEEAGCRCQRCGWNERNPYSCRLPLEIEHVDGNWQNDAPDNLLVLCPNCHSLTATFKGANRGQGRSTRGAIAGARSRTGRLPIAELENGLEIGGNSSSIQCDGDSRLGRESGFT